MYQEVVADRHHIHMNSTIWSTLSNFVQYLGKTNKAVVDHTDKGWHVTYINRDPELLRRQEAMAQYVPYAECISNDAGSSYDNMMTAACL